MEEILADKLKDFSVQEQDTISADVSHYESTIDTFLEDIREETETNASESSGDETEIEDGSSEDESSVSTIEEKTEGVSQDDEKNYEIDDSKENVDTRVAGDAGLKLERIPEKKEAKINISAFKKFERKEVEERFPSYISLLGPESFIKTGAAKMVQMSGKHSAQLKDEVCSAGGTTITGIHALEKGGVRGAIMDAVEAATKKSIEMSQKVDQKNGSKDLKIGRKDKKNKRSFLVDL